MKASIGNVLETRSGEFLLITSRHNGNVWALGENDKLRIVGKSMIDNAVVYEGKAAQRLIKEKFLKNGETSKQ